MELAGRPGTRPTAPAEGRFELSAGAAAALLVTVCLASLGAVVVAETAASAGSLAAAVPVDLGAGARRAAELLLVALRSPAPALALALALERWLPVSVGQRDLTRGFGQDLVWYAADFVRQLGWLPLYLAALTRVRFTLLGDFELATALALPPPVVWALAFVAGDFLAYLSHVARHRFDFLWRFHAVHHSQRELNFFTQHRFHDVDVLVDRTMVVLPLLVLQASVTPLLLLQTVSLAHFRLYHSGIRSHYGPLRFLVVTPQSHRVHHSRAQACQNANFGVFLSVWDRLGGTQHHREDEFPEELGIEDPAFPVEQGTPLRAVARLYAAQILYPFRRVR